MYLLVISTLIIHIFLRLTLYHNEKTLIMNRILNFDFLKSFLTEISFQYRIVLSIIYYLQDYTAMSVHYRHFLFV